VTRRILFPMGTALAILIGLAWLGWRWYTTPTPPTVPFEGMEASVVDAIEAAAGDVRRQPRSGQAWGKLAMVLAAHKINEQAKECYVHAEYFAPERPQWPYLHALLLLQSDPQRGAAMLRAALQVAREPQDRALILFRLARTLIENGELDEAARHLEALGTLEADGPRLHFGLGLLAIARDDPDSARQHLARLADYPFARRQVCLLLANLAAGDKEMAQAYKRQAETLPADAKWPDPFEVEMRSHGVDRLSRIARFTELEKEGKLPEALAFLRDFVATSPDAEVCFLYGFNLYKAGEFTDAAEALRMAIRLDPRNVGSHLFLGVSMLRSGKKRLQEPNGKDAALDLFRGAVAAADHALALQKDLAYAHLTRGQALKYLGRTEESLRALRQAVLCETESAEMHLELGEALAEAGQVREGIEHMENAVRLAHPGDVRPRDVLGKWRDKRK
jgi:tetratricopeptide (TPR) repeat protein